MQHGAGMGHTPSPLLSHLPSHLGHLGQATGVRVLVEEDLVGHLLPHLPLGPLLFSPRRERGTKRK